MSERKRKSGISLSDLLLTTGLLLLAAALFWVLRNVREDRHAGAASEETLRALLVHNEVMAVAEQNAEAEDGLVDETPDYLLNPNLEMPTVEIDGVTYIGFLSIPSLELELPVAAELSLPQLKKTPCYYTGSVYHDNLVIAAHNYQRHFGRIGTMEPGEKVDFTDADGNVFHFQAAKVELLEANEIERMTESEYPLTLFTCTIGGKSRVTLRCEQFEEPKAGLLP